MLRLHEADGSTSEVTLETGAVSYREPISSHWAENVGETTIRLILVELEDAP